jgi:Bacterial Ig-like domain (group 3)
VGTAPTTTSIVSSPNPSVQGRRVTFTATVETETGGRATSGTVTFTAGATALGTVALTRDGVATVSTESLPAGSTTVTVAYNGAANLNGSSAPLTQVVQ